MKMFFKKFLMGTGLVFIIEFTVEIIKCFFYIWGLSSESIFLLYFVGGIICGYILEKLEKEAE